MPNTYTGSLPGSVYPANIPNAAGLEVLSSKDIEGLLNPPELFPDTSRRAAEVTAGRGVGGSAAAYGTGLRMTDEERIRRIALGEQLLSGAYARTLPYNLTPEQEARNQLARDLLDAQIAGGYWSRTSRGGVGGGGLPGYPAGGMPGLTTRPSPPFVDLTGGGVSPIDLSRYSVGGGPMGPDLSAVLTGPQTGVSPLDESYFTDLGWDPYGGGEYAGEGGGGATGVSEQDYYDLIMGGAGGGGSSDFGPPPAGVPEDYWYYGE